MLSPPDISAHPWFYQLSEQQQQRLYLYVSLLTQWNKKLNLIGHTSDIWHRHILDSSQLTSLLPYDSVIMDIGSGAGLPGIVLACLDYTAITLVERDYKKAAVLQEVKRQLTLPITIISHDIRDYQSPAEIITCRAFASIDTILSLTHHLCNEQTRYVLLKGKKVQDELAEAEKKWYFNYSQCKSQSHNEGSIITITHAKPL